MVDVIKRYFPKPWKTHNNTKMMKQRFFDTHLPRIKQVPGQGLTIKHPLVVQQSKRNVSNFLPPIAHSSSRSGSIITNDTLTITNVEKRLSPSPSITYNSAVHEAAQRFILRNNIAKFSQNSSLVHLTHGSYPRRTTLYDHIPAKIDTGLPRADSKEPSESDTHQLEPGRPINWSGLKHDLEQDVHIRAHSNRLQFNSNVKYAAQLTTLGNLVRSKIKTHLASSTGSGDERYKIVVHLTVFPMTAAGLHVASRCLWDTRTDNSITIKMQGIDCDILIIAFLCYTDLGAI